MGKLPYLKRVTDRYGKVRLYLYRPGYPLAPLPNEDDPRFLATYKAALAGPRKDAQAEPEAPPTPGEAAAGTFAELCDRFYLSAHYQRLKPVTQRCYRNAIERLRKPHGDKPVALLDRRGVKSIIAELATKHGAANEALRMIRMLMAFAVDEEDRPDNPTLGIKKLKGKDGGHPAWSEENIAAFEERHPIGAKAHLALALLLYSGQRRSDVVRLGWSNIKGNLLCLTQVKTGAYLEIPIHAELLPFLRACPADAETFLMTEPGKPFARAGFGNWFRDRAAEAGLPRGYNSHGLRKAACRRLAEAGCTVHEIAAISGHKSLAEIERYTKSVNQATMAGSAMAKVETAALENRTGKPEVFQSPRGEILGWRALGISNPCNDNEGKPARNWKTGGRFRP